MDNAPVGLGQKHLTRVAFPHREVVAIKLVDDGLGLVGYDA